MATNFWNWLSKDNPRIYQQYILYDYYKLRLRRSFTCSKFISSASAVFIGFRERYMLWICKRVSIWILDYTLIQREESRSFVFSIVTRVWQFTLRSKKLTFFKTVLESRSFPCPKYFLPFYNQWYFHSEIDSNYDDLRFLDFASFRFKNVKEKKKGLDSFPRVFFDPWSDKLRR